MANPFHITTEDSYLESDFKAGDEVKTYSEGSVLRYPAIVLSCDKLEVFRVDSLRSLMGYSGAQCVSTSYSMNIELNNELVDIGDLSDVRLKILLKDKAFDVFNKKVYLSEDTLIEGDMLFALCVSNHS